MYVPEFTFVTITIFLAIPETTINLGIFGSITIPGTPALTIQFPSIRFIEKQSIAPKAIFSIDDPNKKNPDNTNNQIEISNLSNTSYSIQKINLLSSYCLDTRATPDNKIFFPPTI